MNEHLYTQALQDFFPLPLEQKKTALLELITSFGNKHAVFAEIANDIQTLSFDDEQYIDIYKIILKSMYEAEKQGLSVGVARIEKLHNFLMQLKAREAEYNKKQ